MTYTARYSLFLLLPLDWHRLQSLTLHFPNSLLKPHRLRLQRRKAYIGLIFFGTQGFTLKNSPY